MIWITLPFLVACSGGKDDEPNSPVIIHAIVDSDRPEHYFDVPFPSNDLLTEDGTPDLTGFPEAEPALTKGVLNGWRTRIEMTSVGFGVNTPAYFRFDATPDFPTSTEGLANDEVLWVAMDGSGELLPLDLRVVADALNDPFYADNTVAMAPTLGHPPRSGVTYAAVVTTKGSVQPAKDYTPPPGVADALSDAGVSSGIAVATVFTVQDTTGQLKALADDVSTYLGDWGEIDFKRVVSLTYKQGKTQSGKDSTFAIAEFEDGTTRTAYLDPIEGAEELVTDLTDDWPMMVYEADLPVWNYQGLEDRPYMSPGLAHIQDTEKYTGWIEFENGVLISEPEPEMMRITLQVPKDENGDPQENTKVIVFDHGTSGHAYNIVQRRAPEDNSLALSTRFAAAGFTILGRDAPLYGVRYPLIDEGHGGSLGFYNIVNTPAFRDNQRQTAIDGFVLRRYVDQQLNDDMPVGSIDSSHVRRMGHSLGSVTSNLGLAMAPEDYHSALLSGTGGVFIHYFFDTGLLQRIDPATIELLFPLFGASVPDEITTTTILGAILGIDEEGWVNLDRLHPSTALFQWQMDPSDPMAVARDEQVPVTAVISPGDWQTPDFTAEALVLAMPNAVAKPCNALGDYDPHYCLWREQEGFDTLEEWLATP